MTKEQLEEQLKEVQAEHHQYILLDPQLYQRLSHLKAALDKLEQTIVVLNNLGSNTGQNQIEKLREKLLSDFAYLFEMVKTRSDLQSKVAQIKEQLKPFLDELK